MEASRFTDFRSPLTPEPILVHRASGHKRVVVDVPHNFHVQFWFRIGEDDASVRHETTLSENHISAFSVLVLKDVALENFSAILVFKPRELKRNDVLQFIEAYTKEQFAKDNRLPKQIHPI